VWFIKFLGVLTILATLAMGALVFLQYDEIQYHAGQKPESPAFSSASAWPPSGVPRDPARAK
jgi:hypothetical protein